MNINYTNFLKNYSPKNDMFTTFTEVTEIETQLELAKHTPEEIREIRNDVVALYSALMKQETYRDENNNLMRTSQFWKYSEGMQSVTAVIDNYFIKLNKANFVY